MRISSSQMYSVSLSNMQDLQGQIANTQSQISSGKSLINASDNPVGAVQSQELTQQLSTYTQYQSNNNMATTSLSLEQTALSSVNSTLQSIRDLVVQANTGTLNDSNRQAIGLQIKQDVQSLQQLANSRDSSGNYLFSGNQMSTQPFTQAADGSTVYNGNTGTQQVQVGPSSTVTLSDPGSSVFMNVPASSSLVATANPPARDMFAMLNSIADSLATPTAGVAGAQTTLTNALNNGLTNIDSSMTQISNVLGTVGNRLNTLTSQSNINSQNSLQLSTQLSSLTSLDYTSAASSLNMQMVSLQAAQAAFAKISANSLFKYI